MKIVSILFLLMAFCNINAQIVSYEQAENVAKSFIGTRSKSPKKALSDKNFTVQSQNEVAYYVFNFEPAAYVVVAADYRVHPILAYSNSSNYLKGNVNPAFDWWMSRYKIQIDKVRSDNFALNYASKKLWAEYSEGNIPQTKSTMDPLIKTVWNQTTYYNEFCPEDSNGYDGHCVTGCVATAIGQLMNYFRWPLSGEGSYTSEDMAYGPLTVNYAEQKYNYNEFATTLTRSNPASSKLVSDIGVSCDLHYSASASGMTNHKAAHCMKTFFKYADSATYIYRFETDLKWDSTIIANLDNKIPLYYAGWTDSAYQMGHAFLCDAYDSDSVNYFHFNWGWGGYLDGYFYMDDLTPGLNDFTILHELVINMYPKGEYPYYCNGLDTIRSLDGCIDDGSGPLFNYQNNTDCSWLICPQDSIKYLKLNFLNLNTEEGQDVVTIYDGYDRNAPVLGTYSGNTIPSEIVTSGKAAFVTFTSNDDNTNEGFLLSFKAIAESRLCSSLVTLTEESGSFDDGSNEFDYYANSTCRWRIRPISGKPIVISFSEFDVDKTDKVIVIDNVTFDTIAVYSGDTIPQSLFVAGGKATIIFVTSATKNAAGFKGSYRTSEVSVSEIISQEWQIFPNPATDYITINGVNKNADISIFSVNGKIVGKYHSNLDSNNKINISELDEGTYYVLVETNECSRMFKIVK